MSLFIFCKILMSFSVFPWFIPCSSGNHPQYITNPVCVYRLDGLLPFCYDERKRNRGAPMKITVLAENTACREDLQSEHGLSLFLETENRRILFDAGQTEAFAANAETLGIDLKSADLAILSHGHYDHSGGLARFLEINPSAPVYLHREAFVPHYNADGKYIGVDPALEGNPRLRFTDGEKILAEGITLHSCNHLPRPVPFGSFGLTVQAGAQRQPDDFRHEQYLLIEEKGKRICVSGCSHKGILNILSWFRPDVLIGGFHFMKLDPETPDGREALEAAATRLLQYPTVCYTGHCTGQSQFDFLKARMGERLHALSTGCAITL